MLSIQVKEITFANIEAIIFDKDGTLEDSRDFLRNLAQKRSRLIDAQIPGIGEPLLMAFGVEDNILNPEGLIAVASRQENLIAAAAYIAETGRGWLKSLEIARHAFDEADWVLNRTIASSLFSGSLEVLKTLSQTGLKLGILSADSTAGVQAFVQHHQLNSYFQLQMGVDSNVSKPDPALFLQGCDRLGVAAAHTLMVGDAPGDMQMAAQAGSAGCIGIAWHQTRIIAGADVMICDLQELTQHLSNPTVKVSPI